MMKALRYFVAALGSLLVSGAMASEVVALKFPHDLPENTIKARTIKLFAEKVDEYSNGTLRIDVYPGAQLVSSKDEIRAAIRGQVDIVAPLTSYYVPLDDRWEIFNQPGLFNSFEHSIKVFEGEIGQTLLKDLDQFKVRGIGLWNDGPGYIYTSGEPVVKPEDMAGRKVRVTPSAPLEEGVRVVGASPVSIQAPDVYLALQQGLVNGAITTVTLAASARWYEVLTGMTRVLQQHGGYAVVINQARWDKLSEDHRNALMKAMADAQKWNHDVSVSNSAAAEKTLVDNGVVIQEVDGQVLAQWRDKYKSVYESQSEPVRKLIAEIQSAAGQ
ncbi:MAG: ABC transporter substrate-binding protein [Rhodospirillaceae bacterium]|jgi:C4-dicarboxylate-binding protein DctP|uniref:ABC transporter substrate-binding protein n=3 Tax=Neopusillimonas maritima TaxID=2026239 RepID=A0ABX9MVQ5_9BURK|nr:ABC transporter substrate-binding protein [Rhodospirillaceae bacterium]RII83015.1 hypothetical protein CJO09_05215 [Neopusillimonas maritima]|tara:strand:- start:5566 stop:6552 length:987 start_codon:yes stop_codon:yes gene_type:complete